MRDKRLAAITAAVIARIIAATERGASLEVAVRAAVLNEIVGGLEPTPRERPSERHRRERAEGLKMMVEIGIDARTTVSYVAQALATDPRDPAEVHALAQRLRRLRRNKNA